MRLQILAGILLAFICLQGPLHAATPVDSVALDGLVVTVPFGSEWRRIENTPQRAVIERIADGQRTTLSFSAQPMAPLPEDQAFLRFAEDQQTRALSKLEKVSVHYNWTKKDGTPCLAYDGIFQDKVAHVSPFLSFRGELCRHPGSAGKMIRVELAQRSTTRESAYKIDLSGLAEEVFGAVRFTELSKESASAR